MLKRDLKIYKCDLKWFIVFTIVDATFFQLFLTYGIEKTGAGLGSVLIDSQPLLVAILARAIFGNLINFSPEHPGGVLKLVDQLDSETLFRVVPMQSLKEEGVPKSKAPNLQKGAQYDSKISSALRDARATDDIKIIKKRVGDANKFSKLASESDNYTACFKYSTLSSSANESST